MEMVERFLFDGVDAESGRSPVGGEDHFAFQVLPDEAGAALAFAQPAIAWAEIALDAPVIDRVPIAAYSFHFSTP
jgi:hypothetical protein